MRRCRCGGGRRGEVAETEAGTIAGGCRSRSGCRQRRFRCRQKTAPPTVLPKIREAVLDVQQRQRAASLGRDRIRGVCLPRTRRRGVGVHSSSRKLVVQRRVIARHFRSPGRSSGNARCEVSPPAVNLSESGIQVADRRVVIRSRRFDRACARTPEDESGAGPPPASCARERQVEGTGNELLQEAGVSFEERKRVLDRCAGEEAANRGRGMSSRVSQKT